MLIIVLLAFLREAIADESIRLDTLLQRHGGRSVLDVRRLWAPHAASTYGLE